MLLELVHIVKAHLCDNHGELQVEAPKFLTASDISSILSVSRASAYRIIRILNDELDKKGYLTFSGKIPEKYFRERMYC